MSDKQPHICFVAHYAYGVLAGVDTGHTGGIERQTSLMARWFASRGYDVSMITWDEGQPDGIVVGGVRVFGMCRRDAGFKGLRFVYPKWTSLCQAMKRADADIYYYNCGDLGLGQVVMWCRRHGRQSVYSVASDSSCDSRLSVLKPLRERVLYRYGLRHVDSVIVQTQRQKEMLREGFGVSATVIPMPCTGFSGDGLVARDVSHGEALHVLWVGRISREKRFEWLLDVAERCPEITFDVVGAANHDSEYASILTKRAAAVPNVQMHGRVLHAKIADYYRRCRVLCCTSAYEGFPNTFLEAWSCGIPVVSTFDPDDVITRYGLGWTASCVDEMVVALRQSLCDSARWRVASASARGYYLKNHTLDFCMNAFARVMDDLAMTRCRERGEQRHGR